MRLWPKSKQGKWAVGFSLIFVLLMLIKMQILKLNIRIPLPSPAIAVLGLIGLVLSVLALIQHRDRALSLWLSAGLGLIILFWIIAEIVFPH